jgi:hypothetical protein
MSAIASSTPGAAAPVNAPSVAKTGAGRFLERLRGAMRAALQWRLLCWWLILTALPALALALPAWRAMSVPFDHSLRAVELSAQANPLVLYDLIVQTRGAWDAVRGAGLGASLLFLLVLSPLLNGMFVVAARAAYPPGMGELLRSAWRHYGRMLRLGLVAWIPLGLVMVLAAVAMKGVDRYAEHAIIEADVDHLQWLVIAIAVLLFAWANASVDAGRACLALYPLRRSALLAWWRGLRLVLRRQPLTSLGLYLCIMIAGFILLAVLAWLRLRMSTASGAGVVAGLAVTQAIAAVAAWMHYARQYAMLALIRATELPAGL